MAIEAGQTLDKYELLEQVGAGGMAVVYRGLDKSLKREVAVKILHHHLAESEEARGRFEREAHAVAKLRHPNILEIFDFSGGRGGESYIVTEFIDGQTLKAFVTARPLVHPEVGAMIAAEVCRALAHAHGLGVLHRDIKPENIMIRSDGVVKLTDFGISQMVDLQRMTVTGQLLGSPAYMSPEHVEGEALDFRTDVFALGVVLYQLTTGELPFQGKNPHEILMRIAECDYRHPKFLNPRIGKELGAIITKALSRAPEQRYSTIEEMLAALETYLSDSGVGDVGAELSRYFADPAPYEASLSERLVSHLSARGTEMAKAAPNRALELFNRVLTLDPAHGPTLKAIQRMSRRRRWMHAAMVAAAVTALLAAAVWLPSAAEREVSAPEPPVAGEEMAAAADRKTPSLAAAVSPPPPAAPASLASASRADASADENSESLSPARAPAPRSRRGELGAATKERPSPAVGPERSLPALRPLRLTISPRGSEIRVEGGPWRRIDGAETILQLPLRPVVLEARNDSCCQAERSVIPADETAQRVRLGFLPAAIIPRCDRPDTRVKVSGKPAHLDRPATIVIERLTGTEVAEVEFIADDRVDEQKVTVGARDTIEVQCHF